MKTRLPAALLSLALSSLFADESVPPPLLQFSSGLPGKQVRLTWPAVTGLRYRIEKSSDLGGGGAGGWSLVAMVEATDAAGEWLDPEPTTTRAFYRIAQPQAEVFAITEAVLQPHGGDILIHGQCLPDGSSLVLTVDGVPMEVALQNLGGGVWRARVLGAFMPGANILATAIKDAGGVELVPLNQPFEVTATGRASDSPPSLPPAAPLAASNPIPGVGIVVKKGGSSAARCFGEPEDCDDRDEGASAFLSKKGYDYYQAQSALQSTGAQTNPLFEGGGNSGENPLFESSSRLAIKTKGTRAYRCLMPAPSGLPGEVTFRHVSLDVPCPAGPALSWTGTYRSMAPVDSGLGPGWDFSYNISIEPVPLAAGATAPRVIVRDGGGRADVLHRQADGTYRCDGMFREGRFDGNTFTLTFANTGRWVFRPLDGSPGAGKISSIIDRNDVALACSYDAAGQLAQVGDAFGRSLAIEWGSSPPRILSVTAQATTTSFSYAKITYTYAPAGERLAAISAPFVPGGAVVTGPTTFTYTDGLADPRLNGNVLSVHDGAGRLLEAFTYSPVSDPLDPAYDTCASHDRHRRESLGHLSRTAFEPQANGGYLVYENDEVGRVTVCAYDKMHRMLRGRRYTGFATPGVPVTSANLPDPATKLRATDPDFFETTCAYNADSLCTRITHPDGSRVEVIHDRDFREDCPVRERGNERVITLVSSSGEKRSVRCDYEPGFGSPESARPGNPIGGLTIKGGRNPGGNAMAAKERGITINTSHVEYQTGKLIWSPRSNFIGGDCDDTDDDCDGVAKIGLGGGMPNRISMNVTTPKQTQGATFGERLAGGEDQDCDGADDDAFRKLLDRGQAGDSGGMITRMVTAHGQVLTWGYDLHGNCASALAALPNKGALYQYSALGQCTSATELNGPASSFTDEFTYDPATGFLNGVVCDSEGLEIATTCERDPLGRITRVVDPRGHDWLFDYNPLGQCITASSPGMPNRISKNVAVDSGGRVVRCDCDHLLADGSPDPENPAYSTFYVYDSRARLVRIAVEERPVDASAALTPDALGIENFAVCDFEYDDAGQCVGVSTPAACRGQATDRVCDFVFDERGLLQRRSEGGLGLPTAVTTECDYDAYGALVRCATIHSGGTSPETHFSYDGFHRPLSSVDPMGNETTLGYANDGTVTCSVFGEVHDVPGSAGNVLLARVSARLSENRGNNENWSFGGEHSIRRRVEVLKSNKQGDPDANRLALGSHFQTGDKPTQQQRVICPPNRPVRCWDGTCAAFFGVDVEDDTITEERFTPGGPLPHATEVTVIDRSPAGLVQSVTCNGDTLLACAYDTAGRLTTTTNGASTVTRTRDKGGNILVCGETDHFLVAGTPDQTFTVTRSYDALGRCTSQADGIGNTTTFAFDSLGRRVSVTEPGGLVMGMKYDGSSATGPFSRQVTADLDGDGKPDVLATSFSRCGETQHHEDSYGHRTSFTRDALGRVTRCDHPDATYEETTYDALGRATGYRRKNGAIVACDYNLRGRVTTISHDPASLPEEIVPVAATSFLYNGLGDCVRCEQGDSLLEFTYDSLGNPRSETRSGRVVLRDYNHRGRTSLTCPDGRRFAESRDHLGRVLSVSRLDAVGVPVSPPVVVLQYAGERVWRSTQANGTVTTHVFQGDGPPAQDGDPDFSFDACTEMTVTDTAAHEACHIVQQRDRNQRLSARFTRFTGEEQGPGRSQQFTRDALGRVTGSITRRRELLGAPPVMEEIVTYVLGKEGRRIQETRNGVVGDYTQDNGVPPGDQQMDQYTTWPGGPLDWDEEGNLRGIHRGSVMHSFQYDAEGRLVAVTDPAAGTTLASYSYDAIGRRISSTVGGSAVEPPVVTEFVYDGSTCIQEWTDPGTGTPDAAVTFATAGGVIHGITSRDGSVLYPVSTWRRVEHWGDPHENLRGRVCPGGGRNWPSPGYFALITDAAGAVTERFDCDDAGKPVFLAADGVPTGSSSAIGPIRWMAPEAMWEPSLGMLFGGDAIYCPDLAMTVARGNGHVTVLKAAVQDHNSSRSNKSSRAAAQDHNSSRSNKTSS